MATTPDFEKLRMEMVENQIVRRGIADEKILSVFRSVPRHLFVTAAYVKNAYGDFPLPIGSGQTISQPYIVALMLDALKLKSSDKILEIGTGSGYQTAILSQTCRHVYTVERVENLLVAALERLKQEHIHNVTAKADDGTLGWPQEAPFDKIIVSAATPLIPDPLLDQLKINGRMVLPLEERAFCQSLRAITKTEGGIQACDICGVSFVPLIGRYGFKE